MNTTYSDVTEATENVIRELFANDAPLPVEEIKIRSAIAQAALQAWYENARPLAEEEDHEAEFARLSELAFELPAGTQAIP
ncbi:hypothetical protein bAD24_p00785 (plasmid) [Burkholderia sp. AD24]|nr:hypothetical protein bAD24_p00785 [Burkholderia sp. AD24]